MGVSILYQAIPPGSTLYARLQRNRAFNALQVALFPYGRGVFDFHAIVPEEAEEILKGVIERHTATLGPEAKARRHIAAFLAELERTRAEYPGIEDRTASLEKCSFDVEKAVAKKLQKTRSDAAELAQRLIFGDQELAPHLRPSGEDILGLVSRALVREGAQVLQPMRPEALFPSADGWAEWCQENFLRWRELYFAAAQRSEKILVGSA